MAGGVKINGPELLKTVQKTRDNKDEFEKLYEEIYKLVDDNINKDFGIDGLAWTGSKADQFKTNFNNVKTDFITLRDNIKNQADKLETDVNTWTRFDA